MSENRRMFVYVYYRFISLVLMYRLRDMFALLFIMEVHSEKVLGANLILRFGTEIRFESLGWNGYMCFLCMGISWKNIVWHSCAYEAKSSYCRYIFHKHEKM